MSQRELGVTILRDALLAAVRAEKAGLLASLGLKVIDSGECDVSAPSPLSDQMNQVVGQYGQLLAGERKKALGGYHAKHEFHLVFARLLADTERAEVHVLEGAQKIFNLFIQGDFKLPGYTPTAGVYVEECYANGLQVQEGFPLGEDVQIEIAIVRVYVAAMCYDQPAPVLA